MIMIIDQKVILNTVALWSKLDLCTCLQEVQKSFWAFSDFGVRTLTVCKYLQLFQNLFYSRKLQKEKALKKLLPNLASQELHVNHFLCFCIFVFSYLGKSFLANLASASISHQSLSIFFAPVVCAKMIFSAKQSHSAEDFVTDMTVGVKVGLWIGLMHEL